MHQACFYVGQYLLLPLLLSFFRSIAKEVIHSPATKEIEMKTRMLTICIIGASILLISLVASCSKSTDPQSETGSVANPTITPDAGPHNTAQTISIHCSTANAKIHYTTDGTDPSESSTQYSTPFELSKDTVLKARAFKAGWSPSSVVTVNYMITATVANPVLSPEENDFTTAIRIMMSCITPEAEIRYTADGSDPTVNSTLYSSPVRFEDNVTIKAAAFKTDWVSSQVITKQITVNPIVPPVQMVLVNGGTFNNGEADITISSFYIDKMEMSQASFMAIMGMDPSFFNSNDNRPVEQASWYDAIEYCNRRSIMEGITPCYSYGTHGSNPDNWPMGWNEADANHTLVICDWLANGYRLPTEMEWIWAAKGGTLSQGYNYSGSNTIADVTWFADNSAGETKVVGTKTANELGLYDMSGNVWEWVWDIYAPLSSEAQTDPIGADAGPNRLLMGGAWTSQSIYCKIGYRFNFFYPTNHYYSFGFRVLRKA